MGYKKLKEYRKYFDKNPLLKFKKEKKDSLKEDLLKNNPIYKLFYTKKDIFINRKEKKIHLGNIEDIMMVFDVLKFITEKDENKNIYKYILDKLEHNKEKDIYDELKSKKFRAISDKISTFIIRDIILLNHENENISYDSLNKKLAFPIDTWVRQIANKLKQKPFKSDDSIKKYLIAECEKFNLNSLKVAAGIWYLGANSLGILIENLEKIEI